MTNYFCFKISKPVKVIQDYFGEEQDEEFDGGMDDLEYWNQDYTKFQVYDGKALSLFIRIFYSKPYLTLFIAIKGRKRIVSEDYIETNSPGGYSPRKEPGNDLLMSREMHLCIYKGFEKHFHQLFDSESEILFQNWTIHGSYGDEIESSKCFQAFVSEILSSKEIQKIKKTEEQVNLQKKTIGDFQNNKHQSFQISRHTLKELQEELKSSLSQQSQVLDDDGRKLTRQNTMANKAYGSFVLPDCATQRQIIQTAVDVAAHNIYNDEGSSDSY